jgi:hypothetical protein
MRIVHRVAFAATPAERQKLDELGIKMSKVMAMPGGGDPFVAFDIGEDDPTWLRLQTLLQRWGHSEGYVSTSFTKKELESARWLEVGAWHHGYPQPHDDELGYLQATYDLTDWCESCGIGMKQKAPFQMKREPKWGRNAIMQLIWVYDELFVTPDTWIHAFKPAGVGCRPVLNTKGVELKTVVQLVVETSVGIVTDGLAFERCERCGRTKYLPVTRGAFPALRGVPTASLVRTSEYFGSGGQADQRVLMSQDVARALNAAGVRGAELMPVTEL